jgi:hypothetical protein
MNSILYSISEGAIFAFGYTFCTFVPVIFIFYCVYVQIKKFRLSLTILAVLLSIYPTITPILTELFGYQYFTYLNYRLQQDEALKVSAIILISIFSISIILGSKVNLYREVIRERYFYSEILIIGVFAVNFMLMLLFLEADTIISSGYGQVKRLDSPYSSLVNQLFNLSVVVLFAYISTQSRYRLFVCILAVTIVLCFLMSRRTLALALITILFCTSSRVKLSPAQIAWIGFFIIAMWFVGEARNSGILNYFGSAASNRPNYSLPGGGSNLFIGCMGVIHMLGTQNVSFPDSFPIIQWFSGVYESNIYPKYGYHYNGGMLLSTTAYWNFGLVGVALVGGLLGMMTNWCDTVLRNIRLSTGGTSAAMLALAFTITLPNTLWYKPMGFIKLTLAMLLAYQISKAIKVIMRQGAH